jgi:aryl-alcohol dehydrogenase-like predicted oxidoreductase
MEYVRLGRSGLKVSRIALGCMSFGDAAPNRPWTLDDAGAEPIFRQALELGITFWDTANVYAAGSSEEIVGRAIKRYTSREEIVLATKLFWPVTSSPPTPGGSGLSRKAIFEQVDASLARLDSDYVDLLQIHRFDPDVPVEETMEALHDVVKAGKARYLGASSMWAWRFAKLQHVAEARGFTKFISMQDQYNLLQREEEREMFGLLADQGVGSMPWSPLAAGKVTRPWGETGSARSESNPSTDMFGRPLWLDSDAAVVDAVARIAGERGVSMATVAMAWVLSNPVVDAPIVGATKPHHLADAVAALDLRLTDDEVAALEEHYTPRRPTYFN